MNTDCHYVDWLRQECESGNVSRGEVMLAEYNLKEGRCPSCVVFPHTVCLGCKALDTKNFRPVTYVPEEVWSMRFGKGISYAEISDITDGFRHAPQTRPTLYWHTGKKVYGSIVFDEMMIDKSGRIV